MHGYRISQQPYNEVDYQTECMTLIDSVCHYNAL